MPLILFSQAISNSKPLTPQQTKKYLIVANPEVIGWLDEFVAYRSEDYSVSVANTATIGNTKEKIKAYIQAQYNNIETRPEYLLLAIYRGNNRSKAIPWFDTTTYYVWDAGPELITSYNWYSLLAGNDLIPDVYMGIVTFENKTEVENLLFKIKNTEANGYTNPKNVGYFMSLGWEYVSEWEPMVSAAGYSQYAYHVPDDGGSQDSSTAEFANLLNKNLKLYYLNGHGAPPGLVGIWSEWALNSRANNAVFPLAFSGACHTGNWFLNKKIEMDVFPETMVVKSKDLAVAMLANSFYGGHYDKPMYHEIFRSHMHEGVSQVGKLVHFGKINCLDTNHTDATPFYAFNFEMVHLWGDPATELNGRSKSRTPKLVHVVSGSGDGYYAPGQQITITANVPSNSNFEFDQWTGDTALIADCSSSTTSLTVPNHDVQVEAIYKTENLYSIPGTMEAENANERLGGISIAMEAPVASLLLKGNWLNYNVDVKTSGRYSCTLKYSTLYKEAKVKLLDITSNKELSQATLPVVGSVQWFAWGIFKELLMTTEFELSEGKHTLRLMIDAGAPQLDLLKFTYLGPPTIVGIDEILSEQNSFELSSDGSSIFYKVPSGSDSQEIPVKIALYSMQGKQILNLVNEMKMPGSYTISLSEMDGLSQNMAKGMYVCHLQSGNYFKSILISNK